MNYAVEPSIEVCAKQCGGKCCRGPGHVNVTNEERRRLVALNWRVGLTIVKRDDNDMYAMNFKPACVFLDQATNLCTIYEQRPAACARFPVRPTRDCIVWPLERADAAA